jgi:hypothetical protein
LLEGNPQLKTLIAVGAPVKWHDSNYDERLSVQPNGVTDDSGITLEVALPKFVTEYGDMFGTASVFVGRERSTQFGLDAKHVEVAR